MAPEWVDDYPAFRDYVKQNLGPRPKGKSIDRIDNDEDYEPGNLKFSTPSEQMYNQRRSRFNKDLNALVLECISKPTKRRQKTASAIS
jgi:hypothetical protein